MCSTGQPRSTPGPASAAGRATTSRGSIATAFASRAGAWCRRICTGASSPDIPAGPRAIVADATAEQATAPEMASALEEVRIAFDTPDRIAAIDAAIAGFLRDTGLIRSSLAVRSSAMGEDSARASFAGIHQSRLKVRGQGDVARAVAACYGSLWTPQALAYRRHMGYRDHDVLCAVVLCEMVAAAGADEPVAAGVGFTADPLTGRRDLLAIDAGRGLGEAVVSGRINPQRIVFRLAKDRLLMHARGAGPALLTPRAELELAETLLRVHWALGEGQPIRRTSSGRSMASGSGSFRCGRPLACAARCPTMWRRFRGTGPPPTSRTPCPAWSARSRGAS